MATNHQQCECDQQQLQRYLDDALSDADQQAIETHLGQCQHCRTAISETAADASWWGEASTYLRDDVWDELLETNAFSTSSDLQESPKHLEPIALRQIQEWLDPTDDPEMLGRFGGYEIVGIIGQGGMGVVLKGFERSLNRYVAIKVLAPLLASSGAARKRFAREAKATAAVLHENIIPIHRVDEAHSLPYLVMPYVSDIPLQKRIDDEGPLSLSAILRIAEQIAAGLAAAHAHGLVHRDIKPANILLEAGLERVRITDFGLARAVDDGSLTRTGVIAGTPQYMSPEQARGDNVDARSDLFSLGSVIYAMATGRLPFRAETPYGILRRITDTKPRPVREINPELPAWLEVIIAKLHAQSVDDRYQTASEVADLLRRCLAHVEQPLQVALPAGLDQKLSASQETRRATPVRLSRSRPALVLLAIASAVILLATVWFMPSNQVDSSRLDVPSWPDQVAADAGPEVGDPAVDWHATAVEIEQLLKDVHSFEDQAQSFWGQAVDSATAPDLEPTATSVTESQP